MSDTLTTLLTTAGSAYLGKFVGPAAEAMGKAAWERAQQLGQKATALLAAVGREPQPVEPKLLLPLVQAASLESDPALADIWATLLANAADSGQQVQPSFIEVLRQLTSDDAQVLLFIYNELTPGREVADNGDDKRAVVQEIISHFQWDKDRIELSLDNLFRLRLFEPITGGTYGPVSPMRPDSPVTGTTYGRLFLKAVTPPTA